MFCDRVTYAFNKKVFPFKPKKESAKVTAQHSILSWVIIKNLNSKTHR